jgi:hypothetical protein
VRPWAATRVVLARPSAGLGVDRSRPPAAGDPPAPWLEAEDASPDAAEATGSSAWDAAPATPPLRSPHAAPAVDSARARTPAPSAAHATAHATAPAAPCLHCGGALPSQRGISFCPHCGCDLRRRQCPACSTAMDHQWRFCVTCGRGADNAPPARLAG